MFPDELLPREAFASPGPREVHLEGVESPVAAVLLNTTAPALSRPLDFLVPAKFQDTAQVGVLVKAKVSGKLYTGVIVERKDTTDWQKPLRELDRVLGVLPLLDAATLELLEHVSLFYGTRPAALLRYALPNRRVKLEADFDTQPSDLAAVAPKLPAVEETTWSRYQGGVEFLGDLRAGNHPRAVQSSLPLANNDRFAPQARFQPVAELAASTWRNGEQSLIILPTTEEAAEAYLYLRSCFKGSDSVVLYTSEIPPGSAYTAFLRARFGKAAIVVGTRGAVFLPLARPGLFYLWDDLAWSLNSDMFPNFSARQVLLYRTQLSGAALVLSHYSVNAADLQLVQRNFANHLVPFRETLRECSGRFDFLSEENQIAEGITGSMLLPQAALQVLRQGLRQGPVLVLVPPDGSFSVVSCSNCGNNASCEVCHGPLTYQGPRLICTRCGFVPADYRCPQCGGSRMRGRHLQSRTVIDDIGRFFKGVPVLVSRPGPGRVGMIDDTPRLVIAHSGGEPFATGGYQAAAILRARMLANRTALWTGQEVMRRFLAAGALVKPGGRILVTDTIDPFWQQALIRWDPWAFAAEDLAQRQAGHFAPAWRTALLQGQDLETPLEFLRGQFPDLTVFGPVPSRHDANLDTAFVSVPLHCGADFGRALRALELQATTGRKSANAAWQVTVDPADPGGEIAT